MIIIDLEWNRSYDKIPLEEILQIGAVRIDSLGGRILDTFSVFIRPRVHKKLNRTAKTLPELRASLRSTLTFAQALDRFTRWCGSDRVFADWGGDDFDILRQNCTFWKLPAPRADRLIDLQAAFSLRVGTSQGVALYRAVEYCGIPTPFTFHNALNDAAYTAMLTQWLSPELLSLLTLPREQRHLLDTPPFPVPPERIAGPFASQQAALNSRGCRRQLCPICGGAVWVRRWFPGTGGQYYSDFRCPVHGSFLCRLRLSSQESGQWQGRIDLPELRPALLQEFSRAAASVPIPCRSGQRRPVRRRRTGRRSPHPKE